MSPFSTIDFAYDLEAVRGHGLIRGAHDLSRGGAAVLSAAPIIHKSNDVSVLSNQFPVHCGHRRNGAAR